MLRKCTRQKIWLPQSSEKYQNSGSHKMYNSHEGNHSAASSRIDELIQCTIIHQWRRPHLKAKYFFALSVKTFILCYLKSEVLLLSSTCYFVFVILNKILKVDDKYPLIKWVHGQAEKQKRTTKQASHFHVSLTEKKQKPEKPRSFPWKTLHKPNWQSLSHLSDS